MKRYDVFRHLTRRREGKNEISAEAPASEGSSGFDAVVYNVLFYEPEGGEERSHPIRAAYDALEDRSRTMLGLVEACREQGLLPGDFPLARSIEHIVKYGPDDPTLRELLPSVSPGERHCLNLDPYRALGRIPGSCQELAAVCRQLAAETGGVGAFAFNALGEDPELEKVMETLESGFPELGSPFWFACASEAAPLSEAVRKRLEAGLASGSRSVVFYNRETAVLAARRTVENLLGYPHRHKREPRRRIDTGLWTVSKDGVVQAGHKGPKNFGYYVSKYSTMLQEQAIKPGGLTPDDFDLVLAAFKVESRFPDSDVRFIRVSQALQREFNYLLKIVTRL